MPKRTKKPTDKCAKVLISAIGMVLSKMKCIAIRKSHHTRPRHDTDAAAHSETGQQSISWSPTLYGNTPPPPWLELFDLVVVGSCKPAFMLDPSLNLFHVQSSLTVYSKFTPPVRLNFWQPAKPFKEKTGCILKLCWKCKVAINLYTSEIISIRIAVHQHWVSSLLSSCRNCLTTYASFMLNEV